MSDVAPTWVDAAAPAPAKGLDGHLGLSTTHSLAKFLTSSSSWTHIDRLMIDALFLTMNAAVAFYIGSESLLQRVVLGKLSRGGISEYLAFFFMYMATTILCCQSYGLYRHGTTMRFREEAYAVCKAAVLATIIVAVSVRLSGADMVSRLIVIMAGVFNAATLVAWRGWNREVFQRRVAAGNGAQNVLVVGASTLGRELADCLKNNLQLGYFFCGFLDNTPSSDPRVIGPVDQLSQIARSHFIDEIIITPPFTPELVRKIHEEAQRYKLGVRVIPDLYGLVRTAPLEYFGQLPVFTVHRETKPKLGLFVKRVVDIVVSSALLILTAPLMLLITALIKLDSKGPVLYCANRLGRKGRPFCCYKFRTMVVNADALKDKLRSMNKREAVMFKIKNDPRLTRVGGFLRKYSLDELPQLWNILVGDMSLVGPRPHPLDDCKQYQLEHLRRLDVTPGLTGLWQVSGREETSWEKSLNLDFNYIERWSLWLDMQILFKTIPAVLRGNGE
jgi:exopolysaccharide biosynthesis polyprenyl glycosylphosphotransferase